MTHKKSWPGMLAITLVFGMAVLGACGSSDYARIKQPVMPNEQTAIVYFIGTDDDCGVVWDGETPVGDFDESENSAIMWETTPGSHYFIVDAFNYIVMRANLEPNKRYYVKVETIPNPIPFANHLIALRVLEPGDGQKWLKWEKTVLFNDQWRTNFLKEKQEDFKKTQERLKEAKSKSMDIDLKGSDGH